MTEQRRGESFYPLIHSFAEVVEEADDPQHKHDSTQDTICHILQTRARANKNESERGVKGWRSFYNATQSAPCEKWKIGFTSFNKYSLVHRPWSEGEVLQKKPLPSSLPVGVKE